MQQATKTSQVLLVEDFDQQALSNLLAKYQLSLNLVNPDTDIPGSYWGDTEAGLIGNNVFVQSNTPIHSLLHESCHFICMDNERRTQLDTDAEGDYDEENAVCYLQILLAKELPNVGQQRLMKDMDSWGYTFRLGSAQAWFENDARDAKQWLLNHKIIDQNECPTYALRIN